MLRGIVSSSLNFRFLVVVIAVVIVVSGVFQVRQMPVDFLPELSPPYVEIQTEALGLSAKEVEQMITVPMEQDLLAGVAWLDVIHSESVPGLSSILIYFEPGTDLYRARQMVAERIAQSAVGLPHVSKPPTMIQPLSSASRFMIVGLSSQQLSLIQMSVLVRWVVAPRLMGVPGVAHVAIWGNRDRQLQVQVNPERLRAQGVTLQQVVETTGNALWVSPLSYLEASTPGTGGFIDTPNQRISIWHVLPISSPEDLAQVPVDDAPDLLLGDVAAIVEDHKPLIGDALVNDSPNLLLVIEKLPGINVMEVTRGIDEAITALQPGMSSIDFDATVFRPATFVEMALGNLRQTFVIGALLAVLLLFVFLSDWRATLVSLIAILVSLSAALLVLYSRGTSMNAMVLAGLVLGLGVLIDDAVNDLTVVNRLRQPRPEQSEAPDRPLHVTLLEVILDLRGPTFIAALIAILIVVPVFFLEGTLGSLFKPMALSYLLAVLASLVVTLTLTPALSLILFQNAAPRHHEPLLARFLQRGYQRGLLPVLRRPWLAYAVLAIFLAGGLGMLPFLKQDQLFPSFQEPYLMIDLEGAPGTSHTEMNRIVTRISSELRTLPGVRNTGATVGRAIFGDQTVGINSAQVWVAIDPQADFLTSTTAIRETVAGYPGLAYQVKTYLQQVLSQPQLNSNEGTIVRVFGEEYPVLRVQAEQLVTNLGQINGVSNPRVILPPEEPTLEIEVNLSAAQNYGIKPGDARRAAATLLSGLVVGNLFEEQKVFDVVVWSPLEIRQDIGDVQDLLIETPGGEYVRLGDVADVRIASSPTVIWRDAVSPYLDIQFEIQGRNSGAVLREVDTAVHSFAFPLEYHAEVRSSYPTQQAALQSFLIAGGVILVGIFLLLQAASTSWKLAMVTFLSLPAALLGGILSAWLVEGGQVSLSSLAGLVPVLALTARSSILLVRHCQNLEQRNGEPFSVELVLRGARERLVPTLLTSLTLAAMLLPFLIFGSIPGQEILYPMAVVMLGGLVTATFINLFVAPGLYLLLGASRETDLALYPTAPVE